MISSVNGLGYFEQVEAGLDAGVADGLLTGCVTGVGSLPHTDPVAAVAFVAQHSPQIPFWPQLPQRGPQEAMILQWLVPCYDFIQQETPARINVQPGQVDAFRRQLAQADARLGLATAAGFATFERACHDGLFPQARLLKGQLTGPLTLARCLYTSAGEQGEPFIHSATLLDELTTYLCRLARWQVERLARFGKPVLLMIDEPTLAVDTADRATLPYLRRLLHAVRQAGAFAGIHCCALGATAPLFAVAPDLLSFDAYHELELVLTAPELPSFLAHGGTLALGLVPTLLDLSTFSPEAMLVRWLAATSRLQVDAQPLLRQSLITATCGLGLLTPEAAQMNFIQARRLAQWLPWQKASHIR
ncbi:MAG: hypothetical protein KF832_30945 [Caldilineaceae bacterium]|nr:hypothetical protein [Caldilineaceae bacterium]